MQHIEVTVRIDIDGESKEFQTVATTSGEPTRVAGGLVEGLTDSARSWLHDKRIDANR